jgi:hypothetical protein
VHGRLAVTWRSSDPGVLRSIGGGVFFAQAAGKAKACAQAMGREECVPMEVAGPKKK